MDSQVYTTSEIVQITGFTHRQLDYWAQRGLVVPNKQQSSGPGSRKLYSIENLIELNFVRRLKESGWSTHKIREAVETLKDIMGDPNPLKNAVLYHGGKKTIVALCKTKEGERIILDALSSGGQQVMGIVLETLINEALEFTHLERAMV